MDIIAALKIGGAILTATGAIVTGGANVADAISKAQQQSNNSSNQNEEE